jgi:hypothetical protein
LNDYDAAFKVTLQHVHETFRELLGTTIARWHNVELPEIRSLRADLLGESASGEIWHIEVQSYHDAKMCGRMLGYFTSIFQLFGRIPNQLVLYVGNAPVKMETNIRGGMMNYAYRLVDVRDLDGDRLLASPVVDDNIVGLLTRLKDARGSIRQLLARIGGLEPTEREAALARLLIISELRDLSELVEEEAKKMAILNEIIDHKVLGREYKRGLQEGVQQGELTVLRRLIEKRFGSVPAWAEEGLSKLSAKELEDLSVRVLDAATLEELLQ